MMESILFYPEAAMTLNQKVATEIAPHLFLLCNYAPNEVSVFSHDAKFIMAVNNLYKFAIDASLISCLYKIEQKVGKKHISYNKRELEKNIDLVQNLRTAIAHNVTNENGTEIALEVYKKWLAEVCETSEVTCEADFIKALEALEKVSLTIYQNVEMFINEAVKTIDRSTLIYAWEELIVDFYSRPTNRNILIGQLRTAYFSRRIIRREQIEIDRCIAIWCKNYYCQSFYNVIASRTKILRSYGAKLKADQIHEIQCQINQAQKELEVTQEKIAKETCEGKTNKLNDRAYLNYYIQEQRKKFKAIIPQLIAEKFTMYPSDMMQYIIEQDFRGISLDDISID